MLSSLLSLLKFTVFLPVDIILDAFIFGSIRLGNAYIAHFIKNIFSCHTNENDSHSHFHEEEHKDHDHDHAYDHNHSHHHHHHHHDYNTPSEKILNFIEHHVDYVIPGVVIIALDYATHSKFLHKFHHLPVIEDIHHFIEPHFDNPFLSTLYEGYEAIHTAIHFAESMVPYAHIWFMDYSLEMELQDIEEDFYESISIAFLPLTLIAELLELDYLINEMAQCFAPLVEEAKKEIPEMLAHYEDMCTNTAYWDLY